MQRVLPRYIAVGLACLALAMIAIKPGAVTSSRAPLAARQAVKATHSDEHTLVSMRRTVRHSEPRAETFVPQDTTETTEIETAQAAQSSEQLQSIFDFSALDPQQTAWATKVVATSCDYDWTKLSDSLDGRKVKVEIGAPSARGMYYPSELRVEVHRYYYRNAPQQASRILAWELAHAVDMQALTPSQREQIIGLYDYGSSDTREWLTGPYEDQVGEAFMEGFVEAFCKPLSVRSDYFSHRTTPDIGLGIRNVLI